MQSRHVQTHRRAIKFCGLRWPHRNDAAAKQDDRTIVNDGAGVNVNRGVFEYCGYCSFVVGAVDWERWVGRLGNERWPKNDS